MWNFYILFGALAGAFLLVIGAGAAVTGHPVGWVACAVGAGAFGAAWVTFGNFRVYRGPAMRPISRDGGLELPLRPHWATRMTLVPVFVALMVGPPAIALGTIPVAVAGAIAVVALLFSAWWLHRSGMRYLIIRVDRDGFGTADGRRNVQWRDVMLCDSVDGRFPGVVIAPEDGPVMTFRTGSSSWSSDDIKTLVQRAAKSTTFRAKLNDPDALVGSILTKQHAAERTD